MMGHNDVDREAGKQEMHKQNQNRTQAANGPGLCGGSLIGSLGLWPRCRMNDSDPALEAGE